MRIEKNPVCQGCGKEIQTQNRVVKVEYGILGFTAHPHAKVYQHRKNALDVTDWFHIDL